MGTNYIAPMWRMPENANKGKLSNYSIDFSSTDYINFDSFPDIAENNCYSFSFWFKTTSTSNAQVICDNAQTNLFELQTRFASIRVIDAIAGRVSNTSQLQGNVAEVTNDVRDGEWHHIVFIANTQAHDPTIYNDYVANLYLDGYRAAQVGFSSPTTLAGVMASTLRLNHSFTGQISQFCFFNRVLSDGGVNQYELAGGEVAQLYSLTNPMILSAPPVVYTPLGDNSNPNAPGSFPNISVGADSVFDFAQTQNIQTNTTLTNFGITNEFTVSFWVNLDALIGYSTPVKSTTSSGWTDGFGVYYNGNKWNFFVDHWSNSKVTSDTTVVINQWYHIVGTFSSSGTIKLYINGSEEGTPVTGITLDGLTTSPVLMAGTDGKMSNFQLWNKELIGSEVETLYNNGQPLMTGTQPQENNLRVWYKLDQSANWEADTASIWQISDNRSAYPQSFNFDGSDEIEVLNIGNLFSGITEFSFAGWFNLATFSHVQIFNILDGSTTKFGINMYANQLRFNVYPGVAWIANLQNITSTNRWFHYAGVFDGSGATNTDRLKLYINGQPQTVTYLNTPPYTDTPSSFQTMPANANISIGGALSPFNGMNGKASNIQVWDTSLSEPEIETLYNSGVPLTGTQPQEANLKLWYKLDNTAIWYENTGQWGIPNAASTNTQIINFSN